jgi:hypothetical protein
MYETITDTYPELTDLDFMANTGSILLKDDGDGIVYLAKWEYSKPIPAGLTLGKPTV